jgi:hypothetical protein
VLEGHERDPKGSALALRLMGAVHRLVLEGRAPDLAKQYEDPDPDLALTWDTFSRALAENLTDLRELVERPVQTNEVGRCAALLPGFLAIAGSSGMPLRLLELGASAGLNLRWDRYRYEAEGFAWGSMSSPLTIDLELIGEPPTPVAATVAERAGCDPAPVDPASEDGRLTLLSYIWPDQPQRRTRVEAAVALATDAPAQIERAAAPGWLTRQLAEQRHDLATVVFHSIVMQYLSSEERRTVAATIGAAANRASPPAPLAWLRMEPAGKRTEVRLTTWPGGEERLLAQAGYHGAPVELT